MSGYTVLLLVLAAGIVAVFAIEACEGWRRARRVTDLRPPAWVNDAKPVPVQPHELSDAELRRALRAYQIMQVDAALEYQRLLREQATRVAGQRLSAEADDYNRRTAP